MQVPENPIIDERVKRRRQQDMDGFIDKYDKLVDKRLNASKSDMEAVYRRMGKNLDKRLKELYAKQAVNGVLPKGAQYEAERLAMLQLQAKEITKVGSEIAETMRSNLAATFAEGHYVTAFSSEQVLRMNAKVAVLSEAQVLGVVDNPWLPDGRNYSDRIHANTRALATDMKGIVEEAVTEGLSIQKTAKLVQERTGKSYGQAMTLARTEMSRAAALGQSYLFMQNADVMDGKRWNATLDKKTAPKDAANDGKIYALDYDTPDNEGKPGERIPNHPNCRCKWSPVLSALGVNKGRRIAREDDGKTRTYTKARTYDEYAKEKGLPRVKQMLEGDNLRRYLRKGETLQDYAAAVGMSPEDFLDTVIGAELFTADDLVEKAVDTFVPAETIEEANAWAKENIPEIEYINYTDYDIRLANDVNKNVRQLLDAFPEVQGINFIGTSQHRNSQYRAWKMDDVYKRNEHLVTSGQYSIAQLLEAIRKKVPLYRTPASTIGEATNETWGKYAGIAYNKIWASDYKKLSDGNAHDVASRWSPKGAEHPVSTFVHEFGHQIDYMLEREGLRDKYLTPVLEKVLKLPRKEIAFGLSDYAKKNDKEVFAEAFLEYWLTDDPRPIAKEVGEAMEAALKELRGRK